VAELVAEVEGKLALRREKSGTRLDSGRLRYLSARKLPNMC
jgi:hypothetical protein